MPYESLETLYAFYPAIIRTMPDTFTSHEFILRLAQKHQREYIEALYEFRDSKHRGGNAPFRAVHDALAKKLQAFPELVAHQGQTDSHDIFGKSNRCSKWRKV